MHPGALGLVALACCGAAACGASNSGQGRAAGAGIQRYEGAVPLDQAPVRSREFGAGVQVLEEGCRQGAVEACNGLDDNCNGQIDEGCGYASGSIQITLSWDTGADLDLHVTDPNGDTLYFDRPRVRSGGFLDHDATGVCVTDTGNNGIENAYWNSSDPPPGDYQVEVHYYRECGSAGGPTHATVSIAIGGRVWRSLQATVVPYQRLPIASFSL